MLLTTIILNDMPTPEEVLDVIDRGWPVYMELNDKDVEKLKTGCGCSADPVTKCMYYLMNGLQWRYDLNVYDATTETLYNKISTIIGK